MSKQRKYLVLARTIMTIHFLIVLAFFSSPFFPLALKIIVVLAGISTIPIRIIFFKGDCPLTKLERKYRKLAHDYDALIHKNEFMPVYFKMPTLVFDKVEKVLVLLLVSGIGFEIWTGRPFPFDLIQAFS